MAAQDVPADQLDERIGEWAQLASPKPARRASPRCSAAARSPTAASRAQLALANYPSNEAARRRSRDPGAAGRRAFAASTCAANAGAELPRACRRMRASSRQLLLPPFSPPPNSRSRARGNRAGRLPAAFAAPRPPLRRPCAMLAAAVACASQPVRASRFARRPPHPAVRSHERRRCQPLDRRPLAAAVTGTHLVQLGSFRAPRPARAALGDLFHALSRSCPGSTWSSPRAVVRGKNYWRVSAGGMQRAEASSLCSVARSRASGCHAWAEGRPMKGAVSPPKSAWPRADPKTAIERRAPSGNGRGRFSLRRVRRAFRP